MPDEGGSGYADAKVADALSADFDACDAAEVERRPAARTKSRAKRMAAPAPSIAPGSVSTRSGGGRGGRAEPEPEGAALEPADAWLDFDALVLGPTDDRRRRGRLMREAGLDVARFRRAGVAAVDGASAPRFARDPVTARGRFDHRFEAEGLADVPSGDAPQRVGLSRAKAPCTQRLVTVPVEDDAIYREVELSNPFDHPLLGGPIDVFVGASLLTTTGLERVGRGGGPGRPGRRGARPRGPQRAGRRVDHGVPQRDDPGRAPRHPGGPLVLPTPAALVVVDRIPVSSDEEVEVELVESTPEAERYRQTDRGALVEGAPLEPGAAGRREAGAELRLPADPAGQAGDRGREPP